MGINWLAKGEVATGIELFSAWVEGKWLTKACRGRRWWLMGK